MLKVLYEDNQIIVCYKNKGILSQADGSDKKDMLTLVKAYIKERYNKPGNVYLGLVHRLDINTSGVMVFARTSKAAARLNDAIREHKFEKRYHATVEGVLTNKEFVTLTNYIYKDEHEKKSYIRDDGKEAILEYKVLENKKIGNQDVSVVDIHLKTGRFHQIRCQFSNIGHPLYGDKKYGSKNTIDVLEFPLDAYYLAFTHPVTKEWMEFSN